MPLYEYECESCGNRFELIRKFSDPPLETCPKCSRGPVKKLLSSPAIQFKGTGWYITDYAKKNTTDAGQSGSSKSSDKSSSGNGASGGASSDSGGKSESSGSDASSSSKPASDSSASKPATTKTE